MAFPTHEAALSGASRILGPSADAPHNTPIAEVHAALSDAIGLAGYITEMVDRLAGAMPPNTLDGTKSASPERAGVLGGMADHANEAKHAIRLAHGQLDRLAKSL